jgi:hypothetical protein
LGPGAEALEAIGGSAAGGEEGAFLEGGGEAFEAAEEEADDGEVFDDIAWGGDAEGGGLADAFADLGGEFFGGDEAAGGGHDFAEVAVGALEELFFALATEGGELFVSDLEHVSGLRS